MKSSLAMLMTAVATTGTAPIPSFFASALILPPKDKIAMGMLDSLQEECFDLAASDDAICGWEMDSIEEYQVATSIFSNLVQNGRQPQRIFFPQCLNRQGELEHMNSVLNRNSQRLGGLNSELVHWPEAPASMLSIDWDGKAKPDHADANAGDGMLYYQAESEDTKAATIQATEGWVETMLGKHGLCPYTRSMALGAIGLEHLGIQPGPVMIRHAADVKGTVKGIPPTTAAITGKLFWEGVSELIEKPETEVSTLLLCAPSIYDTDFREFYECLDDLVQEMGRTSFEKVGRVWFHPSYNLEEVGYSKGGHTLPVGVVSDYMNDYMDKHPGASRPDTADLARGHDQTRRMPHATINLLRGKQLKATESNDDNRKHIYARNVIKMLELEEVSKQPA